VDVISIITLKFEDVCRSCEHFYWSGYARNEASRIPVSPGLNRRGPYITRIVQHRAERTQMSDIGLRTLLLVELQLVVSGSANRILCITRCLLGSSDDGEHFLIISLTFWLRNRIGESEISMFKMCYANENSPYLVEMKLHALHINLQPELRSKFDFGSR
jgi:hypothetical protein